MGINNLVVLETARIDLSGRHIVSKMEDYLETRDVDAINNVNFILFEMGKKLKDLTPINDGEIVNSMKQTLSSIQNNIYLIEDGIVTKVLALQGLVAAFEGLQPIYDWWVEQ